MMSRLDVIEVKGDENCSVGIRIIPAGGANEYILEMNTTGALSLTKKLLKAVRHSARLLKSR